MSGFIGYVGDHFSPSRPEALADAPAGPTLCAALRILGCLISFGQQLVLSEVALFAMTYG